MGCHGGFQRRVYAIRKEPTGMGSRCPHTHGESETRKCPPDSCPRPCMGMWSSWSACTKHCGGGVRNRTFEMVLEAHNGGECPGRRDEVQSEPCNTHECTADCVGSFSAWSECSRSCGGVGTQTRVFSIESPAVPGSGRECDFKEGEVQEQSCNAHKRCPRDCAGNWTEWTPCDARCGGGTAARTYRVSTPARHGGKPCPYDDAREDIRRCNEHSCGVDCFGAWTPWTRCTRRCGGGVTRRRFKLLRPAAEGGHPCVNGVGETVEDGDEEEKVCNSVMCESD